MVPSDESLKVVVELIRDASYGVVQDPKILPEWTFESYASHWNVKNIDGICVRLSRVLKMNVTRESIPWDMAHQMDIQLNILKRWSGNPSVLDELMNRLEQSSTEEWNE